MRAAGSSWTLAFSLLGLVTACDEDSDPAEGLVERKIGSEGGWVTSADGVLSISIRPGALREPTLVTIEPTDETPPVFSPVYRVRPNVPLSIPAVVTLRHPLPSDPELAQVGAVLREDFEAGLGQWIALPRLQLDVEAEKVLASDDGLSMFYGLLDTSEVDTEDP